LTFELRTLFGIGNLKFDIIAIPQSMTGIYDERFVFSSDTSSQLIYDEHIIRYRLAGSLATGKRVLDVACGTGYGSKILVDSGADSVKSVDIDKDALAKAKANYSEAKIEFIHDSAESLEKIPDDSIDLIVSFETIEHLPNYQRYLQSLKRVLAPSGIALISTPNKAIFGQKNPFHVKEFTRSEFESSLAPIFKNIRILEQVNGIGSAIKADQQIVTELSNNGATQYFVAVCSNEDLPQNIIGQASLNQQALQRWQDNPGWKMVNGLYKILVKIGVIRK